MRIFKTKPFSRFARKAEIRDVELENVIEDLESGLIDADLGGGVVKQRIARAGAGKSGGFRIIVLFRSGDRAVFVHGFAKNEQGNIRGDELAAFRSLASQFLTYDSVEIATALGSGALIEVKG